MDVTRDEFGCRPDRSCCALCSTLSCDCREENMAAEIRRLRAALLLEKGAADEARAGLRSANAQLNETRYEPTEHGPDAWRRPTAEEYARVCVLYRKSEASLRAEREEAEAGYRATLDGLEKFKAAYREEASALLAKVEGLERVLDAAVAVSNKVNPEHDADCPCPRARLRACLVAYEQAGPGDEEAKSALECVEKKWTQISCNCQGEVKSIAHHRVLARALRAAWKSLADMQEKYYDYHEVSKANGDLSEALDDLTMERDTLRAAHEDCDLRLSQANIDYNAVCKERDELRAKLEASK